MKTLKIKRAYEEASEEDEYRVLVDRLWPRGISKEKAKLDEWLKELGPSTELRKWFGHQPELFPEFKQKYKVELKEKTEELSHLKAILKNQNLTLVYSAKDEQHNQAVVLKEVLEEVDDE